MALNVIYKNRNGTTAEWAASTYILEKGELGVDTTLNIAKIGDGVKTWKDLPTFNDVDISNLVTTDTNQTISSNKLFLNPIQVGGSSNLEDYTKITSTDITVRAGEDASWYKVGNDKFSHGDTTNTYTATLPNKSGTVALLSDIPTPPTNYVTTDTDQTISGSKTFNKAVSVNTDGDASFKIIGGGNTWEIKARTSEGPLSIIGDETGVHSQTYQFPNKSGTIALTNDIPSVPNNILTYDYTFDTTGKNLSYSLMIAKNPNPAESMTRIDAGSITFRDLSRNNYEGTTQLVVAQVNNSNPVVVSLPSTSGELALTSDIPSTDNYVTLDTAQTISGVKTFTGDIKLQGVGIAAKVGGENSSYTNILKGSGNVVEVGSTSYLTRIYSNGRISVYDYSTSPSTSEKVAYQSEIPTNYVTTDTEQDISAIKHFKSRVSIVNPSATGAIDLQPDGIIDMLGGGMYTFKIDATKKQMTVGAMGTNTVLHFNPNSNTVEVPNKSGTIALTEDVNKKLNKPTGNPTGDSVVVVDSSGNVSYKALSDLASQSASDIRSVIY